MVNVKNVEFHLENMGEITTEVIRAYLYQGNPSAVVHRILEGVVKYRTQVGEQVSCNAERALYANLQHKLHLLFEHPLQMIVCMMIGACIGVVLGRFIVTPWLDWLYATLHRLTGFAF